MDSNSICFNGFDERYKVSALSIIYREPKKQALEEKNRWQKLAEQFEQRLLNSQAKELLPTAETINNTQFIGAHVSVSGGEALRKLAFELREMMQGQFAICLTTVAEGKSFVVLVTNDDAPYDCGKWIKEIVAPLINGGGGGKKALATAGGQNTTQLPQVIAAIQSAL